MQIDHEVNEDGARMLRYHEPESIKSIRRSTTGHGEPELIEEEQGRHKHLSNDCWSADNPEDNR
jgi:hypothetical protein